MINGLEKFVGKSIALLGLGLENQAFLHYLLRHKIDCRITVCDMRSQEQLAERFADLATENIKWKLGAEFNQGLDPFDFLLRSPGWTVHCPGIKKAQKKNKAIVLTSPMEIFLESCPGKNTVGVTGTKGKGTTSSLIVAMLKQGGKKVWLGGNIGVAPFNFIDEITAEDWVVLELSSFQLQGMTVSPHIAVFTNFTKEHLSPADPNNPNYHKTLKEYWESKWAIAANQGSEDFLVANSKIRKRIEKSAPTSQVVYFSKLSWKSNLIGGHNKENVAAAFEVARLAQIEEKVAKKAVITFIGLEHRIELAGTIDGVSFYDDSFATTPEATMTALKSFRGPVILLAGGADKGADFKRLSKMIVDREVKQVILFKGQATPRLRSDLVAAGYPVSSILEVDSMSLAIAKAKEASSTGDIVLLSTACASFGLFKNYKERGNLFKQEVEKFK
ncbi:hypothetical protein HGA64_02155 [Candidatus Falkowbacteria bacterium]|nr:hypothetical protein [Candidatus Falkowbacteria bacterium]